MSPKENNRSISSWHADRTDSHSAGGQDLFRRREIWLFAFILLFVLLVFVWQQNSSWKLASDLAALKAEHSALRTRVLGLGADVEDLCQPIYLLAGLDEEIGSQDLEGRVMVAAGPRHAEPGVRSRQEEWLASLGLTVPTALADPSR